MGRGFGLIFLVLPPLDGGQGTWGSNTPLPAMPAPPHQGGAGQRIGLRPFYGVISRMVIEAFGKV